MIDRAKGWALTLWQDFLALTPTEQVTWAIGFVGAALGVFFFVIRAVRRRGDEEKPALPQTDKDRILALIASGDATVNEATELARALYSATDGAGIDGGVKALEPMGGGSGEGLAAIADGDDERRAFTDIVAELATSGTRSDRNVVLQYARGDYASAIATLVRRAEAAGAAGAPIWREVAALARPRDQARAIDALRNAIALDPGDVVSICRLARSLLMTDAAEEAEKVAHKALTGARSAEDRARALIQLSSAQASNGALGDALNSAGNAVDEARSAAAAAPQERGVARILGNAFERLAATHGNAGALVDAREAIENATRIYRALLEDDPNDEDTLLELTLSLMWAAEIEKEMGDLPAAIAVMQEALDHSAAASAAHDGNLWLANAHAEALARQAFRQEDFGDSAAARDLAKSAEALARDIVAKDANFPAARRNLIWAVLLQARLLRREGRVEEAEAQLARVTQEARAQAQSGSDTALDLLGVVLFDQGDGAKEAGALELAAGYYDEALEMFRRMADADPDDLTKRRRVIIGAFATGGMAVSRGDYEKHAALADENLKACREIVEKNPGGWQAKSLLSDALKFSSYSAALQRKSDEMIALSQETLDLQRALCAANPSSYSEAKGLIGILHRFAENMLAEGRVPEAEALAKEAVTEAQRLAGIYPNNAEITAELQAANNVKAAVLIEIGDFNDALALRTDNVQACRDYLGDAPRSTDRRQALSTALRTRAECFASAGQSDAALADIEEALSLLDMSANEVLHRDRIDHLVLIARKAKYLNALGRRDEARALEDEGHRLSLEYAENRADLNAQRNLLASQYLITWRAVGEGTDDEAEAAITLYESLFERVSEDPQFIRSCADNVLEMRFSRAVRSVDLPAQSRLLQQLVDSAKAQSAARPRSLAPRANLVGRLARQAATLTRDEPDAAHKVAVEIEAELDALLEQFVGHPAVLRFVTDEYNRLSLIMQQLGRVESSIALSERTVSQCRQILETATNRRAGLGQLFGALRQLGGCHLNADDRDAALLQYDQAAEIIDELERQTEDSNEFALGRENLARERSIALTALGTLEEAVAENDRALALCQTRLEASPENNQVKIQLAVRLRACGAFHLYAGDLAAALTHLDQAEALLEPIRDEMGAGTLAQNMRHFTAVSYVDIYIAMGDLDAAQRNAEVALKAAKDALAEAETMEHLQGITIAQQRVADVALARGDRPTAIEWYDAALESLARVRERAPEVVTSDWDEVEFRWKRAQATGDKSERAWAQSRWNELRAAGRRPPVDLWYADLHAAEDLSTG
ncbi:hypothetical protein G5B38_21915 (plasmid) [Pseudohalocynthiibacter aestuariivivens]|nr:hypothetical protein [Pseudohalocynthiibacter aestuariivivens]QIE48260.1 hypothetical protein G5B38_21915 [Pseudohalocynthiibacter aestuariivivens]